MLHPLKKGFPLNSTHCVAVPRERMPIAIALKHVHLIVHVFTVRMSTDGKLDLGCCGGLVLSVAAKGEHQAPNRQDWQQLGPSVDVGNHRGLVRGPKDGPQEPGSRQGSGK